MRILIDDFHRNFNLRVRRFRKSSAALFDGSGTISKWIGPRKQLSEILTAFSKHPETHKKSAAFALTRSCDRSVDVEYE